MLPNLFYIVNFSISILASSINILIGFLVTLIVIINRQCRTITNTMICNTAGTTMIYSVLQLVSAGYSLREDWFSNQPACIFRAYCYFAICVAVSGSYAVLSIHQLFFTVLYKHRYFLYWRIHLYLIIVNGLWAIVGPIPILFVENGYQLEAESRICTVTTKIFLSSMLAVIIAHLIPLSIVVIVYGIIFYSARQSTRRVGIFSLSCPSTTLTNNYVPNLKREMKLMKNILILVGVHICAGIPYLILVMWNVTQENLAPEWTYLPAAVTLAVFSAIKMIMLFHMNKEVKGVAVEYLRKLRRL